MKQRQSYSKDFKNSIRSKILSRGNRTVLEICEQEGINPRSAANWIRPRAIDPVMKRTKSNHWTPEQKLEALMETSALSEPELGAYLRKSGLLSTQLEEWKKEFLSSMAAAGPKKTAKDDRDQKIKVLEREILRKDRALAEASALLILQKKVNLIWGHKDEDEK